MLSNLVEMSGLEPPTPTLSGWCSNRLSYISILNFFLRRRMPLRWPTLEEPAFTAEPWRSASCEASATGWCSNRLSYIFINLFLMISKRDFIFCTHPWFNQVCKLIIALFKQNVNYILKILSINLIFIK